MHYNIWLTSGTVSLVHHKIHFDIPKKQDLQVGILNITNLAFNKQITKEVRSECWHWQWHWCIQMQPSSFWDIERNPAHARVSGPQKKGCIFSEQVQHRKFPQICLSAGYRCIPRNQNMDDCVEGQHLHIFPALWELLINRPDSLFTLLRMWSYQV